MFNEKMHAFIPAVFYRELDSAIKGRGKEIFILATERYGWQRGSRMAQRVLRDGNTLNYINYVKYGEWEPTLGLEHTTELKSVTPDYSYHILKCPWHDQFTAMGAGEAGKVYCTYLDKAIARGYNPRLGFQVNSTLHTGNRCEFVLKEAYLDRADSLDKNPENVMTWEYHCAHIYYAFADTVVSICSEEGDAIVNKATDAIIEAYGQKSVDIIKNYKDTDFSIIQTPAPCRE